MGIDTLKTKNIVVNIIPNNHYTKSIFKGLFEKFFLAKLFNCIAIPMARFCLPYIDTT